MVSQNRKMIFNQWIQDEFNQSYEQLRDRDNLIIDIFKFYFGLLISVLTIGIGIYEIPVIKHKRLWISILLILSGFIGIFISLGLLTIRKYFVIAAKQLNAIRNYATKHLTNQDKKKYIVQSTDLNSPNYWNFKSYHSIVIIIQIIITVLMILSGVYGLAILK